MDCRGPPGLTPWRFTVDPDDAILELDEGNNLATASSRVLAEAGLELVVAIDQPVYLVGQQLTGEVFFASSDPPQDIVLETRLEDAGGRLVAVLDTRICPLRRRLAGERLRALTGRALPGPLSRPERRRHRRGSSPLESLAPFQLERPALSRPPSRPIDVIPGGRRWRSAAGSTTSGRPWSRVSAATLSIVDVSDRRRPGSDHDPGHHHRPRRHRRDRLELAFRPVPRRGLPGRTRGAGLRGDDPGGCRAVPIHRHPRRSPAHRRDRALSIPRWSRATP